MQKKESKIWKIVLAVVGILGSILAAFLHKPKSGMQDLAKREKELAEKKAKDQQEEVKSVNEDIDDFNLREDEVEVPKDLSTLRKKYDEL